MSRAPDRPRLLGMGSEPVEQGHELAGIPGLDRFSGVGVTVGAQNLYTWTNYRGFDPEIGLGGGNTGSAALARVEGYQYPLFRTLTATIELIF